MNNVRNRVQMSLIFFIYEGELTIYSDPLSYILTNILYRWWSIFLTPTHSSVSVFLFYALTFCRSHFLLKPNYPGNIFFFVPNKWSFMICWYDVFDSMILSFSFCMWYSGSGHFYSWNTERME